MAAEKSPDSFLPETTIIRRSGEAEDVGSVSIQSPPPLSWTLCEIQGAWNRQQDEPPRVPDRVRVDSGASTVYGRKAGSLGSLVSPDLKQAAGIPKTAEAPERHSGTSTSNPDGLLNVADQRKEPPGLAPPSFPQKMNAIPRGKGQRR